MIFTIGEKQFKSKSKATEYFKEYFQGKWKRQENLTNDDKIMLKNLLKQRVDFEIDFIDNVISDFQIITNKFCAFEIQYYDLSLKVWVPFSIAQCIVGKAHTDRFKICKEFREKINDQIQNYRKQFISDEIKCQLCNCKENIEVDHIYPFASIVDDYLALKINEDLSFKISFEEYHLEKAKLRFLCSYHNKFEHLKSGPKKTMSREEYLERNRINAKIRYLPKKKLL